MLYRSLVTKGAVPAETVIGEPEEIGYTIGIEVGNIGFDYNTGRMYGVDLTNGGLCIVDLETGRLTRSELSPAILADPPLQRQCASRQKE